RSQPLQNLDRTHSAEIVSRNRSFLYLTEQVFHAHPHLGGGCSLLQHHFQGGLRGLTEALQLVRGGLASFGVIGIQVVDQSRQLFRVRPSRCHWLEASGQQFGRLGRRLIQGPTRLIGPHSVRFRQ